MKRKYKNSITEDKRWKQHVVGNLSIVNIDECLKVNVWIMSSNKFSVHKILSFFFLNCSKNIYDCTVKMLTRNKNWICNIYTGLYNQNIVYLV